MKYLLIHFIRKAIWNICEEVWKHLTLERVWNMINEEEEACVRLNSYGIKSFNKIYYGRPQYDRIEKKDDQTYLYFRCSLDQLFLYFKRFENGSAEVLHPESLRNRMIKFHEDAIEVYRGR